ncbi:hypothetical protein AAFN88_02825 [Pelagibius sp. CAU 1746]|uniref:hypothetical protein n=1 Tax=Pelagibius sp. CAU 1746 TaxID=3140370 RepID=UPI00325A811F
MAALLLAVSALGACAPRDDAPRPMHISSRAVGQALTVTVDNIPPGRAVTELLLIDPAGGATQARERELSTRETASGGNAGPGVAVGATGGSSSGVRPYISLGYLFRGSGRVERSQRLTGEIPIPDPAAYAAGYRGWRIVLRYRDQLGEVRQVTVPAPPPER